MPRIMSVALAVVLCSCTRTPPSGSAEFPLGSYRIRSAQIDYIQDNSCKIYDATQTYVQGRYEVNDDTIVMTDVGGEYGCKGDTNPGTYKWSYKNDALTFSLLEDRCEA